MHQQYRSSPGGCGKGGEGWRNGGREGQWWRAEANRDTGGTDTLSGKQWRGEETVEGDWGATLWNSGYKLRSFSDSCLYSPQQWWWISPPNTLSTEATPILKVGQYASVNVWQFKNTTIKTNGTEGRGKTRNIFKAYWEQNILIFLIFKVSECKGGEKDFQGALQAMCALF